MTTGLAQTSASLELDVATVAPNLRPLLAVREFALGRLNLVEASTLAGLPDLEFIDLLARVGSLGASEPAADRDAEPHDGPAPRLSVVIPMYNEAENLFALHTRLTPILASLGTYEIIFVDDGSRDRSPEIVLDLQRKDATVRLVRLSRNFGHQAALSAGIDHARGDAVVLMDADLQDPPELLPRLVAQWENGHEVVYAVREKRDEGLLKRVTAAAFYRLLATVSDVEIPVDTGDFCLMDRRVADVLRSLPEKNRFLRGLRSWAGFRQVGVPYERPARHAGDVKYTVRKMVKLALDGIMAFTSVPLRLASYLGILTAAAGIAYLAVAVVSRMTTGTLPQGWTSLVAIMLVVGGAQLLVTGVLGAYIARIYEETKGRPMYVTDPRRAGSRGSPGSME